MTKGRFIVLEGGEGVGKSTQARLLADEIHARGLPVVLTREPGGTPGAEAIRELLLHPSGEGWDVRTEALLFAASRADHVSKLIRPALANGKWVICDRFIDSTRAYQGGGGGLDDADILALHVLGSEGLLPDLTLVLSATEAAITTRLAQRDEGASDAIGGRDASYHARVAVAFADFAKAGPGRYALIDGGADPEQVHERIMEAVEPLLAGKA
jgi:dTMP kinase